MRLWHVQHPRRPIDQRDALHVRRQPRNASSHARTGSRIANSMPAARRDAGRFWGACRRRSAIQHPALRGTGETACSRSSGAPSKRRSAGDSLAARRDAPWAKPRYSSAFRARFAVGRRRWTTCSQREHRPAALALRTATRRIGIAFPNSGSSLSPKTITPAFSGRLNAGSGSCRAIPREAQLRTMPAPSAPAPVESIADQRRLYQIDCFFIAWQHERQNSIA